MIDKLGQALDFNAAALKLAARRQEILAANIANADTPNYRARDFSFEAALRSATEAVRGLYRLPTQPSIDGNTVDMDTERAQFAENAVRYEAALRFLNGQIKTILSAIQG
jgi:flagellar basal-body rod protein FlgB